MGENGKRRGKRKAGGRRARRIVKRVLVIAVVLVAGAFGLRAYLSSRAADGESEAYVRARVTRGAMSETVYGTGTTSARSQPSVLAEAGGTLTDLRVSVGDAVRAGDVLAVLQNDALDDEITDLEFKLWDLDDTISQTEPGGAVRVIESPVSGRVTAVYAGEGDDALAVFRREGALAIISTDGRMRVELTDLPASSGVALGDRLTVEGDGFSVEGTVTDVTRQGTQATVTILGDELPMGAAVRVRGEDGAQLGTGTLEVNKPMGVSSYGGTISSVAVAVGDTVRRRDTLFRLEDSPLTLTIENLRIQREAAAAELEDAKAERENLIVLAPCDGVVASVGVQEGDEVNEGALLLSILEGEDMNLTIGVDELDVVRVEPGQRVDVTVDALGDAALTGTVSKVAPVGSGNGGVTTYDVELELDAAGSGVRSGMNATGEITVASSESTLYVPVEALMTVGNQTYVMVENASDGAAGGASDSAPAFARSGGFAPADGAAAPDRASASETPGTTGASDGVAAPDRDGASDDAAAPDRANAPDGSAAPDKASASETPDASDDAAAPDGASASDASDAATPGAAQGARVRGAGREGRSGGAGSTGTANTSGANGAAETAETSFFGKAASLAKGALDAALDWLYGGHRGAQEQAVSGALVPVTVGMQNDDYAELLSGVSEGDVVLYEGDETQSGGFGMGAMGGMSFGGMAGGMPGGMSGGRGR